MRNNGYLTFLFFFISDVKSWREGGSSLNKSGGTGTGEAEGLASTPGAALDKDRPMMPPHGMPPPGIMNGAQGNAPPPGPMPQQFRGMMPQYVSTFSFSTSLVIHEERSSFSPIVFYILFVITQVLTVLLCPFVMPRHQSGARGICFICNSSS